MSYRSSARSNEELVKNLVANGLITSQSVMDAMMATDRKHYSVENPYQDSPQFIGCNVTISAPHMHAWCLELLNDLVDEADKVLDVGCGSGFLTACLARMVPKDAVVVGIDHVPELVELSTENINNDDHSLIDSGKIILSVADGFEGFPSEAPYDCIHVGAAAPKIPQALIDQLKVGGKLVIPVGTDEQNLIECTKTDDDGNFEEKVITGVRYVPLTSLEEQFPQSKGIKK